MVHTTEIISAWRRTWVTMNRKLLLITILVASSFLVFLGMRNPYLSGGSAPKQRPRAVVEHVVKNALDVVQQVKTEAADPHGFHFVGPVQYSTKLAPSIEFTFPPFIPTTNLVARAPPSHLPFHS